MDDATALLGHRMRMHMEINPEAKLFPMLDDIAATLGSMHLTNGQRIALGIEIEHHLVEEAKKRRLAGLESLRAIDRYRYLAAAAVGLSEKTLKVAKEIRDADPVMFEKIKQGKISVGKAKNEINAVKIKRALADAQKSIDTKRKQEIDSVCDLRVCSCKELFRSGVRPDVVITDPPYPREFLHCFTELAEGCKYANVPIVAVMSGKTYLPEVIMRLCEHLKYRWAISFMMGPNNARQWQAKVYTSWKPVFIFGNSDEWFNDVIVSESNDKQFHKWGQPESVMAKLVERLSKPGQLICDPFLGGGTTAVVALALGRRFVGCDVDESCIEITRARVLSGYNTVAQ